MTARRAVASLFLFTFLSPSLCALGQSQTTGRIAGMVKDESGAVIVGAEVTATSLATAEERKVTTNAEGNYSVPLLPPGEYSVKVAATGFKSSVFAVEVVITQTTTVNAELTVSLFVDPVTVRVTPLIQTDGPQMGR